MELKGFDASPFIFFLVLGKKLPRSFFFFSSFFSEFGVTLVPVKEGELKKFIGEKRQHVLAITDNLEGYNLFERARKLFLEFSVKQGRIQLYHLSSFRQMSMFGNVDRKRCYNFFQLPLDMEEVGESIVKKFQVEKEQSKKWPGGRRARLPF